HAAGPRDRPGRSEADRVRFREHSDSLGAIDEDAIAREQIVNLLQGRRHLFDELSDPLDPGGVYIEHHAADAKVTRMKSLAGGVLDNVVNILALLKAVQKGCERS